MSRKEQTSPFNMWWWAAAGFIVVVLIAALGLVFLTKSGNNSTPESEQQPPAEGVSNPPAQTKNNECQGLSDDQSYPTSAPETKWEAYDGSALTVPVSEEYGPLEHDGKLPKCFAHSPAGAVYAAPNLVGAFGIGQEYGAAVDSPEAKELFEEQTQADHGNLGTIRGFRIDSYTGSEAEVSLYIEQGDISAAITVSLIWDDKESDWRLNATPGFPLDDQAVSDNFVMWR